MSKEIITQYIAEVNRIFRAGNATEHSYRPALKSLLENITSPNPSKGGELDKGACPLVKTSPFAYANFHIAGSNVVEKVSLPPCPSPKERGDSPPSEGLGEVGKVYINDTQYFNNVPLSAWNFYIGGYQPAQKWLKDLKGKKLGYDDIEYYQKIIRALKETEEIMKELENLNFNTLI